MFTCYVEPILKPIRLVVLAFVRKENLRVLASLRIGKQTNSFLQTTVSIQFPMIFSHARQAIDGLFSMKTPQQFCHFYQ